MQSTVAPPLAYAWPPRFIFVNPLPDHLPGPGLKFARKSSNPRNEKILNRSCSVLQAAAFNLLFIIFWNMQQMGPIQGMFGEQRFGGGGYDDADGGGGGTYNCVGDVEPCWSKSHDCQQPGCLLHCHIHPNHALTSSKNQPIFVKRRGSLLLDFVGLLITPDIFSQNPSLTLVYH